METQRGRIGVPDPDLETEPFFPSGHCEHLQGAPPAHRASGPEGGNLMEKGEIASVPSQ